MEVLTQSSLDRLKAPDDVVELLQVDVVTACPRPVNTVYMSCASLITARHAAFTRASATTGALPPGLGATVGGAVPAPGPAAWAPNSGVPALSSPTAMTPKTKPTTKVIPATHHRSRRVWAGAAGCGGRSPLSLEFGHGAS